MLFNVIFILFFCIFQPIYSEFHLKFIGPANIIRHLYTSPTNISDIIIATHHGFLARIDGENGSIIWRRRLTSGNGIITKLEFNDGYIACMVKYMTENLNDGTYNNIPIMNIYFLSINDGSLISIESDGWDSIEGLGAPSPVLFSDSGYTSEIIDSTQKVKNFCLITHNRSTWLVTLKTGQIIFTNSRGKEKFEWIADPDLYGEDSIFTLLCQKSNTKNSSKFNIHLLVQRMSVTNFSTHFPIESIVTLDVIPEDSIVYERISHITEDINIPKGYLFISQKSKGQCLAQLSSILDSFYLDVYRLDSNNLQYFRIDLGTDSLNFENDNLGGCKFILKSHLTMEKHLISVGEDGAKHLKLPRDSTPCYCANKLVYLINEIINGKNHISLFRINNNVKLISKFTSSNLTKVDICSINNTKWTTLDEGIGDLTLSFEDQTLQYYNKMKFRFERFESLSNIIKTMVLTNKRPIKQNWFLFEFEIFKFFYRILKNIFIFFSKILPFIGFKTLRPIPFKGNKNSYNIVKNDHFNTCEEFIHFIHANQPCILTYGKINLSCANNINNQILPSECAPHHHMLYHLYNIKHTIPSKPTININHDDILLCVTSNNMIFALSKQTGSVLYHLMNYSNTRSFNGNIIASKDDFVCIIDGLTGNLLNKLQLTYRISKLELIFPKDSEYPLIFTCDGSSNANLLDFNLNFTFIDNVTIIIRDGDSIRGYSLSPYSTTLKLVLRWCVNYSAAGKRISSFALYDGNSLGICEFNNDNTFSIPFINPHLLYIVSMDSSETMLDVLDSSQGKILATIILTEGATAPFKLLSIDNLLALHYWNSQFNRYELMILEVYNGLQMISLVFGAPFGISAMSVTRTKSSKLGKKYLFALSDGHFILFDESIINARRPMSKNLFTYFFASIEDKILPNQVFPRIHDKVSSDYSKEYEPMIRLENGKILRVFIPECRGIDGFQSEFPETESYFAAYGFDLSFFIIKLII